jgi:quercetin dioxygenase-like cupin family protein
MNNHKIYFDGIEWINAGTGVRYKAFIHKNQRLRLIEFSDGFIEQDWCIFGHAGIVLDGSFAIDFNGNVERYSKGDVIFIPCGEPDKHKAMLAKNEKVTLLLFELINN